MAAIQKGGNFVEAILNLKIEKRLASFGTAAVLSAALLIHAPAASAATAFVPFYSNYDTLSQYGVKDIAIFEDNQSSSSITNSFNVPANSDTVITNPFAEPSPITGAFLLGVATNLASDGGDGQSHLVLFANTQFANSAQNIAFGTLFPNTDEGSLINALEVIGQDPPGGDTDLAYGKLGTFQGGDAASSPNGPVSFQIGDAFEEVAFSNGQIIGGGTSFATPVPITVSAAPEPSTWLLLFAGLGGIGLMLRRAKKTMGFRFKDAFSA